MVGERKKSWPIGVLPGMLLALQPLLRGQFPQADATLHLYWLAQLQRAIQHGIIFPRWLADLGLGYGYPLFNYYAPLGDYLALPALGLGANVQTALSLSFALALLTVTLGIYGWTRELFGKTAAIGAAVCVGYAPYILYDIYHRGALAESWGLAMLSMVAWGMTRLMRVHDRRSWALAVISFAGLMLSHNLTAMIGAGLVLGYTLILGLSTGNRAGLIRAAAAFASGLGLSAFFWLPAFMERELVQYQLFNQARFDYHNFFITLSSLLTGPTPIDSAQVQPDVPIGLGWLLPLLALTSWIPGKLWNERSAQIQRLALTIAGAGLALMALNISLPIWETIGPLRLLQYPWRFLGPASLVLAVLAGAGISQLPLPQKIRLPLLLLLTGGFALTWLFLPPVQPQPPLNPPDIIRFEIRTGGIGATAAGDFLPRWVEKLPPDTSLLPEYDAAAPDYLISRLDPESVPAEAKIIANQSGFTDLALEIDSPQPFTARFRWYYLPNWQAWIDGVPQSMQPDSPNGLLTLAVPAGRHQIKVALGLSPLQQGATWLSGGVLILCIILLVWPRKTLPEARPSQPEEAPAWTSLGLCALVGLGLLGIKAFYLDSHSNLLHPLRYNGQQIQGAQPQNLRFGTEIELMGDETPALTLKADDRIPVTLYWRALGPINANYSVALHLIDGAGHLYGQEDHQHPDGYPTRELLPDRYIRDAYALQPWSGAPPGQYTLTVSLYNGETGEIQSIWDRESRWLGASVPLATVTITRPQHLITTRKISLTRSLYAGMGDYLQLIGTGELPAGPHVGDVIPLILYWQSGSAPQKDYLARLQLLSPDGKVAMESTAAPGGENYPTSNWSAGTLIREARDFRIPALRPDGTPLESGTYTLTAVLLDSGRAPVKIGTLSIQAPERTFDLPAVSHPLDYRLGNLAILKGYHVEPLNPAAGNPITLTLYWQTVAESETRYTVFVHLLDEKGALQAQQDRTPQDGQRPTTSWAPGEIIADTYQLALPEGSYQICLGMYDPRNNQRLRWQKPTGEDAGDYLCLPQP